MHSIKEAEYIKAVNEKSKLLKDKREGVSPAESSPDWKKAEVHSGADWRKNFRNILRKEYVSPVSAVIELRERQSSFNRVEPRITSSLGERGYPFFVLGTIRNWNTRVREAYFCFFENS